MYRISEHTIFNAQQSMLNEALKAESRKQKALSIKPPAFSMNYEPTSSDQYLASSLMLSASGLLP